MSLVAVLPVLAAYEIGLILLRSDVEAHAGSLMKRMLAVLSMDQYLALTGAVAVCFFFALLVKHRGPAKRFQLYGAMMLEGALYGALLAPVVFWLEGRLGLLAAGVGGADREVSLLLGVGAGVWEELVFRLVLLGGFLWVTVGLLHGKKIVFGTLGILFSSLAFSGFHHLGGLGDLFTMGLFFYRFLAGVVLASVFLLRGLGVCVYTHALYNVGVLLLSWD